MKKLNEESLASLEAAVRKALSAYQGIEEGEEVLTDLYVQVDRNTGDVAITDDDDRLLATVSVPEWAEVQAKEPEREYKRELSHLLRRLREAGALEGLGILRPYSFVLVDDHRETLAELMLVDDDTLLFDRELLTGLDEELDRFLEDLLKD